MKPGSLVVVPFAKSTTRSSEAEILRAKGWGMVSALLSVTAWWHALSTQETFPHALSPCEFASPKGVWLYCQHTPLRLWRVARKRMSSISFSVSHSLPFLKVMIWFLPETLTLGLERSTISGMARSDLVNWVKWTKMVNDLLNSAPTTTLHLLTLSLLAPSTPQ